MPSLTQMFHMSDVCLLMSSFLPLRACRCLRKTSPEVLTLWAIPQIQSTLSWRFKLNELFAAFDLVLIYHSPSPVCLDDVRSSFRNFVGTDLTDEILGQLLALAGDMIKMSRRDADSEFMFEQQSLSDELQEQKNS
jgi:hypothetical protein